MIKYNDYIEYKDICKKLKRFSFDEKMRICQLSSWNTINARGEMKNLYSAATQPLPWEIETFLLMAIKATPEYAQGNFKNKNERVFRKMINSIRFYRSKKLENSLNTGDFVMYATTSINLLQFDIQRDNFFKMYRYNYFFNFCNENIDMRSKFIEHFKVEYENYILFSNSLILFMNPNNGIKNREQRDKLKKYIYSKFSSVLNKLIISVEDYKIELDKITTNINDYATCLRPSYTYPFIKFNNLIYLPLPHLVYRAVTSSLLYRMTRQNNELRSVFGKEVLEAYLYQLLKNTGVYDEVYPEREYRKEHNNKARTLDVMVRYKEHYLFFDSKAFVPLTGLRIYDGESYDKQIERLADNVVQVFNNIRVNLFKYSTYSPFINSPSSDINCLWGIVVLLEDCFLFKDRIYELACRKLKIEVGSKDYQWIIKHIRLLDLSQIEFFSFIGTPLLKKMNNGITDTYDIMNDYTETTDITNKDYVKFENMVLKKMEQLVHDFLRVIEN